MANPIRDYLSTYSRGGDTRSCVVDRWNAIGRGWQAVVLGLSIVFVHAIGQWV